MLRSRDPHCCQEKMEVTLSLTRMPLLSFPKTRPRVQLSVQMPFVARQVNLPVIQPTIVTFASLQFRHYLWLERPDNIRFRLPSVARRNEHLLHCAFNHCQAKGTKIKGPLSYEIQNNCRAWHVVRLILACFLSNKKTMGLAGVIGLDEASHSSTRW